MSDQPSPLDAVRPRRVRPRPERRHRHHRGVAAEPLGRQHGQSAAAPGCANRPLRRAVDARRARPRPPRSTARARSRSSRNSSAVISSARRCRSPCTPISWPAPAGFARRGPGSAARSSPGRTPWRDARPPPARRRDARASSRSAATNASQRADPSSRRCPQTWNQSSASIVRTRGPRPADAQGGDLEAGTRGRDSSGSPDPSPPAGGWRSSGRLLPPAAARLRGARPQSISNTL